MIGSTGGPGIGSTEGPGIGSIAGLGVGFLAGFLPLGGFALAPARATPPFLAPLRADVEALGALFERVDPAGGGASTIDSILALLHQKIVSIGLLYRALQPHIIKV